MAGRIRYLVLSPSSDLRAAFLGNLFGSFELSPQGSGERVALPLAGGGALEVVGAGAPGLLLPVIERFLARGADLDGVLLLLASGDQAGWEEARGVREALAEKARLLAVRAFVLDPAKGPDRAGAKSILLALVAEQERLLGAGR